MCRRKRDESRTWWVATQDHPRQDQHTQMLKLIWLIRLLLPNTFTDSCSRWRHEGSSSSLWGFQDSRNIHSFSSTSRAIPLEWTTLEVLFPFFSSCHTLLHLAISFGPLESPAVNFYRYFYHSIFPLTYFHISLFFPISQHANFPTSIFPSFLVVHTLLRRAISVGPLGGRQGCHCQPPLSPPLMPTLPKNQPQVNVE